MAWWQGASFYQVYPRSFLDTDGDGVGDLEGVRRQIPYLVDLGIDAIWLCPIYPSPMRDNGYDVSDYCDVDPVFGSLSDFDRLLGEVHAAGLKLILDWVPNHTSIDHPWFVEARGSRDSQRREWFVWRELGPEGRLPNNWLRAWSDQPAWTLDESTGQLYLHSFLPEQPDLNWASPEVRRAMLGTLEFWIDRGVDGFRMDVVHLIGKDAALPDDPEDLVGIGHVPLNDVSVTHEYVREIRATLDAAPRELVSVGEVYLFDPEAVASYYGNSDELHLSFNFLSLMTPWRARAWFELIERTESSHTSASAWPTWTLSNHDNRRVASRLGADPVRVRSAMVLLLTLRGSPFLYQGEELGLLDGEVPESLALDPGHRDGCRTPIPWSRGARHGWAGEPWLPFAVDADRFSVEALSGVEGSMLTFTKTLLELRRAFPSLRTGELTGLSENDDVLRYVRRLGDESVEVAVNFSKERRRITSSRTAVLARSVSGSGDDPLVLAPGEAMVVR
jgi:alpha-glucosidase